MHQEKNGEPVGDQSSVGDGGEKQIDVIFVDRLRVEGNDPEEISGFGAKLSEHRRLEVSENSIVVQYGKARLIRPDPYN